MFGGTFLDFLLAILWFYILFMVIMMFVQIFADIIRRENLSGWGKAGWILLLFVLPFIGALIYVIVRPKNTEQDQREMKQAVAMQQRIQGGSAVEDIARAKELLDSGAISQAEYDAIKAKALA